MMTLFLRYVVYLLTLCGLCAFAVNYTAWYSSYLFYTVLFLPIFSLLLSLWPYMALRLTFTAPLQVHRGDAAELTIAAAGSHCPYFLPITMTVTQRDLCGMGDDESAVSPRKGIRCKFAPYPILVFSRRGTLPHLQAKGGISVSLPTMHTAVIRTEIKSAFMWDFLGLFPLPLRLSAKQTGTSSRCHDITVLPVAKPPEGKLRMWDNSQSALVPTQRPAEQYEIRTYRPGDALRSVHWKLTAKLDDILVRESVEPRCHVLAIALERIPDREMSDVLYDTLDWMLRALCVKDRVQSVVVGWVTHDGRTCTETLYDLSNLDGFYRRMLSDTVPAETPPHAFAAVYKSVDRGYHLDIEACLGTDAPITVTSAGNDCSVTELTL